MHQLKTTLNQSDVSAFLEKIDDKQKKQDSYALVEMMRRITNEQAKMWGNSLVGFGKYCYQYASGQEGDWPLVAFSPRKQKLTVYIMPGFESYSNLMEKLGKYQTGKSCLYIKKLTDVDTEILQELIKESVKYMKQKYNIKS